MSRVQSRDDRNGRWFYDKAEIEQTPSRRDGIDKFHELQYRQRAASLIQDCGKKLSLTQLTINTAIVYMHRFFMMHSFKRFDKFDIAAASLFLAAKVEETPRKLQHVIFVLFEILHKKKLDDKSEEYKRRADILVEHELIMLQTFGFDISIDHPHTHVIRATQFMRAPRELSQVAYFMATNSLYLTTFCLEMRSEIVAATCIYLAFKWSEFEVGLSNDGRAWWTYLDQNLDEDTLKENVRSYINILQVHPAKLKEMKQQCESQNSNPAKKSANQDARSSSHQQQQLANQKDGPPGGQSDMRDNNRGASNILGANSSTGQKRDLDETDQRQDNKRMRTDDERTAKPLPPLKMPGQNKDVLSKVRNDKDHRRSAPGRVQNAPSETMGKSPSEIIDNRPDGESLLPTLKQNFNFLKECLKRKDLWKKLSDEEKQYCYKTKEKMRKQKQEEQERRRRTNHGAPSREPTSRGPPNPNETKAATDSLMAEFD